MSLPQQQLAFVPIQLCCEPALPCPFDDLQRLVQLGQGLFNLPCDLTRPGEEGEANEASTTLPRWRGKAAEPLRKKRYPLRHIAILDLDPAAIDRSLCDARMGKPCSVATATTWSAHLPRAASSPTSESGRAPTFKLDSQNRRMSRPPSLSDCCAAPCQCLVRIAKTEKDDPQDRLRYHLGVASGLMEEEDERWEIGS